MILIRVRSRTLKYCTVYDVRFFRLIQCVPCPVFFITYSQFVFVFLEYTSYVGTYIDTRAMQRMCIASEAFAPCSLISLSRLWIYRMLYRSISEAIKLAS